jgi:predicted CoA-binding protein
MAQVPPSIAEFLRQKHVAVVGVSRDSKQFSNAIYRTLRKAGSSVYAVNPNTEIIEGDACYPSLDALPQAVDGAVLATTPEVSERLVEECARLGIRRVWMHRSFGTGSVSDHAVRIGRERGMTVIAGGCPMMFCEPVDPGHRCIRWFLRVTGKLPTN